MAPDADVYMDVPTKWGVIRVVVFSNSFQSETGWERPVLMGSNGFAYIGKKIDMTNPLFGCDEFLGLFIGTKQRPSTK